MVFFYSCLASCNGCTVKGILIIAALSLQALLFYGESPAAIKLVDNRPPFQSCELLHALAVESCHPRRVLLILFTWVRHESYETPLSVKHTWISLKVALVRRRKYSRKLYELKDLDVLSMDA
jgi:hypothetical protein